MSSTAAAHISEIDPFVIRQAEIRASRMVGNYGFTRDDWGDLRQEMLLEYLKRRPRFDVERGDHQGFTRGILQNRATKLAARRSRIGCFEPSWPEADWNRVASCEGASLDLRLDVQAVVARLPVRLRILARQLSEMDLADIQQQAGRSRSRVHQWIGELRAAFIDAGLAPANRGDAR
jgi:RNA polymerase sigma-70 factor, ECF subfamily